MDTLVGRIADGWPLPTGEAIHQFSVIADARAAVPVLAAIGPGGRSGGIAPIGEFTPHSERVDRLPVADK